MSTDGIVTGIDQVPVTLQRPPPVGLDKFIPSPGVPRANSCPSKEKPQGDPKAPSNMTAMQQHVAFWDRDGDGVIWPHDTFIGFRRLGFNLLLCLIAVPFIHGSFSYPSGISWIPDPFMRIYVKNMHRCKHGSDSEVYDTEGRYVPQKFEEIFSKYDQGQKGGLDLYDIWKLVVGNMNIVDPVGWIAERLEWYTLWLLCKDENGFVSKEKIRAQYDGTLWNIIAKEVEEKKMRRRIKKEY